MAKFRTAETVDEYVDQETGEIVRTTTSKVLKITSSEDPFFMTYTNQIAWIYGIKNASYIKVLFKILETSAFNTGECLIPTNVRKQWCATLSISDQSLSKALKYLVDNEIISGEKGVYQVNPAIFWKGDRRTREQLLNAGCEITITPTFKEENSDAD